MSSWILLAGDWPKPRPYARLWKRGARNYRGCAAAAFQRQMQLRAELEIAKAEIRKLNAKLEQITSAPDAL